MKKKLDPSKISSELKDASLFFRPVQPISPPTLPSPLPDSLKGHTEREEKTDVSVKQPLSAVRQKETVAEHVSPPLTPHVVTTQQQKTGAQTPQHTSTKSIPLKHEAKRKSDAPNTKSTSQSTDQLIDTSPVLGKPKGFYITEKQNNDLDVAVTKLAEKAQGRTGLKIDRSTLLRLLLEYSQITDDSTIDSLCTHLVNRLVNQLKS